MGVFSTSIANTGKVFRVFSSSGILVSIVWFSNKVTATAVLDPGSITNWSDLANTTAGVASLNLASDVLWVARRREINVERTETALCVIASSVSKGIGREGASTGNTIVINDVRAIKAVFSDRRCTRCFRTFFQPENLPDERPHIGFVWFQVISEAFCQCPGLFACLLPRRELPNVPLNGSFCRFIVAIVDNIGMKTSVFSSECFCMTAS